MLERYRREGIAGLRDRPKSGRPRLLGPAQEAALRERIEAGPDHARDGVATFRGVDTRRLAPLPLPPYSPELNPMELAWRHLRGHDLANRAFAGLGRVSDACCAAWNELAADPEQLTSLTDFAWARPNPATS